MVRPRRGSEWVPITARLDPDASRRLRVAAARQGTTQGRILDALILTHLPPDPLPDRAAPARTERRPMTARELREEMDRLGITQTALAQWLGITQKAVSEWFERDRIPPQRMETVARFLTEARKPSRKG